MVPEDGIEAPNIVRTDTLAKNVSDLREKDRFDAIWPIRRSALPCRQTAPQGAVSFASYVLSLIVLLLPFSWTDLMPSSLEPSVV